MGTEQMPEAEELGAAGSQDDVATLGTTPVNPLGAEHFNVTLGLYVSPKGTGSKPRRYYCWLASKIKGWPSTVPRSLRLGCTEQLLFRRTV